MSDSVVLVGIAGNNTAYSLSLYNLKAYAMQFSALRRDWEIVIWWWVRSPIEISSKWIVEYLNDV